MLKMDNLQGYMYMKECEVAIGLFIMVTDGYTIYVQNHSYIQRKETP